MLAAWVSRQVWHEFLRVIDDADVVYAPLAACLLQASGDLEISDAVSFSVDLDSVVEG